MAASVIPDPVGAFNETFRTADTSARDWERIALLKQQQMQKTIQDAVETARQRKADDFNQMMKALDRQSLVEDRAADNARQDAALGISRFNADTSRYNALHSGSSGRSRSYSDDPLGLSQVPASVPVPVESGADNFLPTPDAPPDGRETGLFPVGLMPDPVSDLPPPSASGRSVDTSLLNPDYGQQVPRAAPIAETVDATVTEAPVSGSLSPDVVPAPVAESSGPALLPPPVVVPSISEVDISQDTRNTLFNLERESKELAKKAAIQQSQAVKTNSYLNRGNLRDPEAYRARAEEQQLASIESAGAAQEAAAKAARLKEDLPKIQKRQEVLASIADLDSILPPSEKAALIKMSADPATGGQADRQLNVLSAYSKVRQERGLDHVSNGMKTAEMVARTGANLATTDAKADKKAFDSVRIASAALKDPALEPDEIKAYRKEIRDNAVGAEAWANRVSAFGKAVEEDKAPDAPVAEEVNVAAVVAPPVTEPAPTPDIIAAGNTLAAQKKDMVPADQEYWTQTKNTLREKLGGEDGIRAAIAEQGGVKTLDDLKNALRTQSMLSRVDSDSKDVFPKGLPKGAWRTFAVTDALAEDIWRATGRPDGKKVVPGAAPISTEGRSKIEAITAKFEKKPGG